MMDFDERVPVGSNMYLPSCTYYVSGTDFSSLPPFLPQAPSSCPVTYSYSSSNLPQVQSVREVAFRDYGIDTASKWHHHRGNLSHCCSAEDVVHRDCLSSPGTLGEMFAKNNSVVYHSASSHASNLYGGAGRNGVLPQAFDQFFETAYGSTESVSTEQSVDRTASKPPPPAPESGADTCRETGEKERLEENSSPESSSGNNEEKYSSSGSTYTRAAQLCESLQSSAPLLKVLYACFISAEGLWRARSSTPTKLCYKREITCLRLKLAVKQTVSPFKVLSLL